MILPGFAACIPSCIDTLQLAVMYNFSTTAACPTECTQATVCKDSWTLAQAQNTNFQSKFECNIHPTSDLLEVISTVKCIAKENVVPDEHSFPGKETNYD